MATQHTDTQVHEAEVSIESFLVSMVGHSVTGTPGRFTRAFREMTSGYRTDPAKVLNATFSVEYDEIVLLRNIDFKSLCEHHLLPFVGVAHVAYLPGSSVVGISKLARLVECYARRLQIQERLTTQVAHCLMDVLKCRGAVCIMEASHCCMACRGVNQQRAELVTSCVLGEFRKDDALRAELFGLLYGQGR